MSAEDAPTLPPPPLATYTGGCHCGRFAFEIRHPALDAPGVEVTSCNCSICTQRGYLFIYITDLHNDFTLTKGAAADLARYRFNTKVVAHAFCPVCGCGVFEEVPSHGIVGINLRAVAGVDLDTLTIKKVRGEAAPARGAAERQDTPTITL